jgi:hypothetical protein
MPVRYRPRVERLWQSAIHDAQLAEMHDAQKLTPRQIGEQMGFSHVTINQKLREREEAARQEAVCAEAPEPEAEPGPVSLYIDSGIPLTPWHVRQDLRALGFQLDVRATPGGPVVFVNQLPLTLPQQIDLLRDEKKRLQSRK